jgi:hypothetical protein
MGSMNMPYSYFVTGTARLAPSISTLTGVAAITVVEAAIVQPTQAASINPCRIQILPNLLCHLTPSRLVEAARRLALASVLAARLGSRSAECSVVLMAASQAGQVDDGPAGD